MNKIDEKKEYLKIKESNIKILLIHQYAGNKGDRAVLYSLCKLLRSIIPNCFITVSTSSPELWQNYAYYTDNSVLFIPSAWDYERECKSNVWWALLKKVKKYTFTLMREASLLGGGRLIGKCLTNPSFYASLKNTDLVISVGGHHFTTLLSTDLVSSINFDTMIAAMLKKSVICFSQSFGPFVFKNKRNHKLTQQLLSSYCELFAREKQSVKYLNSFNISGTQVYRTFETVIALNSLFSYFVPPTSREKKIGIAIYCTQRRTDIDKETYTQTFVEFCKKAIYSGYKVCFFPMELKNTPPDDRMMIRDIVSAVHLPDKCFYIDEDMDTELHLREVAKCRIFIGHKTHSTIFALVSGTPLIGIAYHPKTLEFMKQFGVSRYCIDDRDLTVDALYEKLFSLEQEENQCGELEYKRAQEMATSIHIDLKNALYYKIKSL